MNANNNGPSPDYWSYAGRAAIVVLLLLFGFRAALLNTGLGDIVEFLVGIVIGAVVIAASFFVVQICSRVFHHLSNSALVLFVTALVAIAFFVQFTPATVIRTVLNVDAWKSPIEAAGPLGFLSVFVFVLGLSLLAAIIWLIRRDDLKGLHSRSRLILFAMTGIFLIAGALNISGLIDDGDDPFTNAFQTFDGALPEHIAAPNPSLPGRLSVTKLSYGAGPNLRRPEFGAERDLESRTVDAAKILPEWEDFKQQMRERYWGFGLDAAPLNGLVWTPEGNGPFPLVLIVHGNHGMEDYSDPGYAYLGELLASRGIIAVSVDQNYINGTWSGDFQGKEMPARAWLLLEHLRLWRDWNSITGHQFEGKIDLDNIALIGHSRGGEAIAMSYAYNALPNFPDDATVGFDYGFSIQALVALAQIDQRYHRRVELTDVNFLALQGSYDSDESAFHGLRQFNRIDLSKDEYRFKAGLYIHGANHGQFNSTWGRTDSQPPNAWQLNLAPIIPGEDQRQIAKVYTAAFLAATLQNDSRYMSLFRDPRTAADWLPNHALVQQFTDSNFIALANFDEDLDVTTASATSGSITANGFDLWREEELRHRDELLQGTNAVVLGWAGDNDPVYTIDVPSDFWPDAVGNNYVFSLSVSASTEKPQNQDNDEKDNEDESPKETMPPRFTIEAYSESGLVGIVDSAEHAHLAPPLKARFLKSKALNDRRYKADWEPILQVFEVPLEDFAGDDVNAITRISIRFDKTEPGVVILDNIGIRSN